MFLLLVCAHTGFESSIRSLQAEIGGFGFHVRDWFSCSGDLLSKTCLHRTSSIWKVFVLVGWLVCSCVVTRFTHTRDWRFLLKGRGPLGRYSVCFVLEMARLMDERWGSWCVHRFQFTTSLVCRTVHHCHRRRRRGHPFYLCPWPWASLSPWRRAGSWIGRLSFPCRQRP